MSVSAPLRRWPRPTALLQDLLAIGVVLVVYAVIQTLLFIGPQPYDPSYYFVSAPSFPHVPANVWMLRIGLMGPLAVAVRVFGTGRLTFFGVPILASAALGVAVYVIARLLSARRVVAASAALVTICNPIYLLDSTSLFPDVVATATFAVAIMLLILGGREELRGSTRLPVVIAGVAGFVLGWTYLIREFSPILLPSVIVAVVLLRYPLRRVIVLVAAAVVTVSAELIYGAVRYGDALTRLHLLTAHSAGQHPRQFVPYYRYVHNVGEAALVFPNTLVTFAAGWVLIALLVLFVVALGLRPDRGLVMLAAWLFLFWAAMSIIGVLKSSNGEPVLGIAYIRYWYPVLPALIVGGFLGLQRLAAHPRINLSTPTSGVLAVALVAAVLVPGTVEFAHCKSKDLWDGEPSQRWTEVHSWLASPAGAAYDLIVTDRPSKRLVRLYSRSLGGHVDWHGRAVGKRAVTTPPHHPHALILIDRRRALPGANSLGPDWQPVFVSSDGDVAILAHDPTTHASAKALRRWQAPLPRRADTPGSCGVSKYRVY